MGNIVRIDFPTNQFFTYKMHCFVTLENFDKHQPAIGILQGITLNNKVLKVRHGNKPTTMAQMAKYSQIHKFYNEETPIKKHAYMPSNDIMLSDECYKDDA
jgi:RNA recognition motif-containing protein